MYGYSVTIKVKGRALPLDFLYLCGPKQSLCAALSDLAANGWKLRREYVPFYVGITTKNKPNFALDRLGSKSLNEIKHLVPCIVLESDLYAAE